MGNLRDGKTALGRLPAGHGHRIVIKNLVGDVDAGCSRGAQRQQSGMRIGAVAEILEDVLLTGEGRLTDPVRAFAAHLRDGRGAPGRDPKRHAVTADAGHRAAAVRHLGRGVVRTAGAEIRGALQRYRRVRGDRMFERFQPRQPLFEHRALVAEPSQPRNQRRSDDRRRQFAAARQQRRPLSSRLPTTDGRFEASIL